MPKECISCTVVQETVTYTYFKKVWVYSLKIKIKNKNNDILFTNLSFCLPTGADSQ